MKKTLSMCLLLMVMAVLAGWATCYAEQFEKNGYIINAAVKAQCEGDNCFLVVSGTVSGSTQCQLLAVEVLAVDEAGKEAQIKAMTSRNAGESPLSGKTIVKGAGSKWTIKGVETNCDCA